MNETSFIIFYFQNSIIQFLISRGKKISLIQNKKIERLFEIGIRHFEINFNFQKKKKNSFRLSNSRIISKEQRLIIISLIQNKKIERTL